MYSAFQTFHELLAINMTYASVRWTQFEVFFLRCYRHSMSDNLLFEKHPPSTHVIYSSKQIMSVPPRPLYNQPK